MSGLTPFESDALQSHNKFRQLHGVQDLRVDPKLTISAQMWADTLAKNKNGKLEHSPLSLQRSVGENVSSRVHLKGAAMVDVTGQEISEEWYNDIHKFDFNSLEVSGPGGSSTQMIWKKTLYVGFGVATTKGRCIVVAHYSPHGNITGELLNNVFPAGTPIIDTLQSEEEKANRGKLTHTKVMTNTVIEPSGEKYTLRKEICEYTNEQGIISQSIKILRVSDPDELCPVGIQPRLNSEFSDGEDDGTPGAIGKLSKKKTEKALTQFQKEILKRHNFYRKHHGVSSLKLNKELSQLAQKWAEKLVQQAKLRNSATIFQGDRVGENVASRWSQGFCNFEADDIIDHWYSESKTYQYGVEPSSVKGIGNFTQLVWRNSQELGIGKAVFSSPEITKVVVVCYYHPAGNVLRCFNHNVLPIASTHG